MIGQAGRSNPLDDLSGFPGNPAAAGGSAMPGTLFGSPLVPVQNAISSKTGLPPAAAGKVLEIAAPMVMGYIAKASGGQKRDGAGPAGLPGDQSKSALAGSPDTAALAQQLTGASADRGGATGFKKTIPGR